MQSNLQFCIETADAALYCITRMGADAAARAAGWDVRLLRVILDQGQRSRVCSAAPP